MLYSIKKYQARAVYLLQIDVNHIQTKNLFLSNKVVNIIYSTFFRKLFIRTLLLYLNHLYCNFFFYPDYNIFYFTAFMYANYSRYHPSFYHKNMCVV